APDQPLFTEPEAARLQSRLAEIPAPPAAREPAHLTPRTPAEELVAGLWSEVLGREGIGAEDDFFALGGHSLLAVQVALRLRGSLQIPLPLRRLVAERS